MGNLKFKSLMNSNTYLHGLRTPNEAFFHWNPELLGLGTQIGQINSGAFGVFLAELSAPILLQWVPCPYFPLYNHYFYKKLSLYIRLGQAIGPLWGFFGWTTSTHFGTGSSLSMFSIIQPLFLQKTKPLYPHPK